MRYGKINHIPMTSSHSSRIPKQSFELMICGAARRDLAGFMTLSKFQQLLADFKCSPRPFLRASMGVIRVDDGLAALDAHFLQELVHDIEAKMA